MLFESLIRKKSSDIFHFMHHWALNTEQHQFSILKKSFRILCWQKAKKFLYTCYVNTILHKGLHAPCLLHFPYWGNEANR